MKFFRKAQQQPGWLAIQVLRQGVNLAHVTRTPPGKPKVVRCESRAVRGEQTLEKLRKDARLGDYQCTTLLKPGEYQMLLVDALNVPPQELKTAMRWRIKDLLDYHIDDATVDVLGIPADKEAPGRERSMYAVAARNETVQKCVSLFEQAEIPLRVIDIPEMAQRNIAALYEPQGAAVALLSFDDEGGLLTITSGGELYASRRIDVSQGQLNDADEKLRRQNLDRVVLELQRSLDHFDRQYHYLTLSKLLLAPLPEAIALRERLAANLDVPVEVLDLHDALDFSSTPELMNGENQAQSFMVLGAALRQEEKAL